ncbi:uncharacterized protein I206_106990 [Kwoniella pini CBS 10737]|uniref:Uncharacterized protein n=1 Tax=Kwoniella pini CBS 10737 TaxID=1296096 RepID=A0A1B9HZG7_9TREE|nr:uncharacterized protein I206_05467 [Kwoniella pini CBS 10737]OCF48687.1 hypothetical protein I206_05467 [Kwoniella pini CBS 10737]
MTRPKSKQSPPPPSSSTAGEGHCHSCGRLLPRENKADPTPRKYCSSTCRSHSKSTYLRDIRFELVNVYHSLLMQNKVGKVILCSEAEKLVFSPASSESVELDKTLITEDDQRNESRLPSSEQREESRRAARRLVAFGFASQGIPTEDRVVEAIQNGKIVETSFAKGEWGIRWK